MGSLERGCQTLGDSSDAVSSVLPGCSNSGSISGLVADIVIEHLPVSFDSTSASDQARHALLALRLQKSYLIYCASCCMLAVLALLSEIYGLLARHLSGESFVERGMCWEHVAAFLTGLALCVEVAAGAWLAGPTAFFGETVNRFDAGVAGLVVLSWFLHFSRWSRLRLLGDEAEELDLPLLMLRFSLQPLRVCATFSVARQVRLMQSANTDIVFDDE